VECGGCAPLGGQDVGRGDEHADRSAERKGGDLLARLVDLDAQPIFYEDLNARHGAEEGLVGDDASAVATWSIAERECFGPDQHIDRDPRVRGAFPRMAKSRPSTRTPPLSVTPGIRFMVPTNSATKGVAGRA